MKAILIFCICVLLIPNITRSQTFRAALDTVTSAQMYVGVDAGGTDTINTHIVSHMSTDKSTLFKTAGVSFDSSGGVHPIYNGHKWWWVPFDTAGTPADLTANFSGGSGTCKCVKECETCDAPTGDCTTNTDADGNTTCDCNTCSAKCEIQFIAVAGNILSGPYINSAILINADHIIFNGTHY